MSISKQRKYAGRLWPLADHLSITGGAEDALDLSISPVSGASGERYRVVVTAYHGTMQADGDLSFVTEVSGTVLGLFNYPSGTFDAPYNPSGWLRGGFGENLVVSSSQDAELQITFAIEPEDN